jgi:hypothetical protein
VSLVGRQLCTAGAVLLILSAQTACGAGVPTPSGSEEVPWDEPVAGAVAVTEWRDDGEPVGPFGPDGPEWGSAVDLVAAVAAALAQSGEIGTAWQVVSEFGDDAVGWVRLEAPGGDSLAADLRLHLRRDGSTWFVARSESRVHCAVALADGLCP